MRRGLGTLRLAALLAAATPGLAAPPPPLPPLRAAGLPPRMAAPSPGLGPPAASVPVPPPRPVEFGAPSGRPPGPPPLPAIPAPHPPAAAASGPAGTALQDTMEAVCVRLLASGKVEAERAPAVSGDGGCGIAFPVTLKAVVLADGRRIGFRPPALMRCDLADRLADWVRGDLATLESGHGALTGIENAAAYVCRTRNHVAGAKLSEHGLGTAIDILALSFAASRVDLRQADAHPLWLQVKLSACARFSTVLGPGSDGYHEDNLHLDLENRHNGSHYCHWDNP